MVAISALLLIMANLFFNHTYGEQFDIWGDLTNTKLILGSSQTKYAFPLMKRTIEVTFPDDFDDDSNGIIRGIQHSNRLTDKDCQPEARLVNGGVNELTATIRITSVRGCGLESFVEFFIQPPQTPIIIP